MTILLVEAGETTDIPDGDTEYVQEVRLDGTLRIDGTLAYVTPLTRTNSFTIEGTGPSD